MIAYRRPHRHSKEIDVSHYHISDTMQGGYLPSYTATVADRDAAVSICADRVREYEDDAADMGRVIHVESFGDSWAIVSYPNEPNRRGQIIEREYCDDESCEVDA